LLIPSHAPAGIPEGKYELRTDLDGNAVEDVTSRVTFDERDAPGKQRVILRRIEGARAVDPYPAGPIVARRTIAEHIVPYEVGTAAGFGFTEQNGRTLTDNAQDVMFSIAANAPVHLGIGKESIASRLSKKFPYMPYPIDRRSA
jgi:hypothetical protein